MWLLDHSCVSPAENLALDEALLLAAEAGTGCEVLRFWESPGYAVVLGAGGSVAIDVNLPACAADHVPVLRRASGGGTVLLGPGCLNFSFVLAYEHAPGLNEIPASNRYVLGRVLCALHHLIPEAMIEGTSDLARNRIKFSGNAQQRKRRHFLHHGTLLYDFDLSRISKYLNAPERQPEYRANRRHNEFISNLPCHSDTLKKLLAIEWQAEERENHLPLETMQELLAQKYTCEEWNRRRG